MPQIATTTSLAYINSGLATSTTYFYSVTAQDSVGDVSASSNIASGTTQSGAVAKVVTFVQQAAGTTPGSATSLAISFTSGTTAGDVILVGFDKDGTQTPTITDTQGNSFVEVGSELTSPGAARTRVYYAKNIKGGADTVTVALSKSSSYIEEYLTEYAGANTSTPIDVQAGKTGSAGTVTSGSATTTVANEIIYGYCEGDYACTAGSGFTARSTLDGNLVEDKSATTVGSYAATASANNGWTMQMVAVRP
jgi:hypothetical protein